MLIAPNNKTIYNFRGDLLKKIISCGHEVTVTGPEEKDMDKIQKLGVNYKLIKLNRTGLSIIDDLKYLFALYKFFKKEKPDLTLGYTIKPVIYGAIAARLAGIKNIISMVTGVGYLFTAKTLKARCVRFVASILYRIGFRCADTVIFQNMDDLYEFTKLGLLEQNKCRVVNGSGVNMEHFKPAELPERLSFLMVSRIIYGKGIREYLEAAKRIKAKYPEVRFMLLGAIENLLDSMKEDELKPYVDDGIVEYFGETDDVSVFFKQCSVYVLPSYREGISRTILEAMAMGRPIITTDAPGCRETVLERENGFLVPVKDSDALAEKMEWFINNQQEIARMGKASIRICRDKFDVNKVNQVMLKHMNVIKDESDQ